MLTDRLVTLKMGTDKIFTKLGDGRRLQCQVSTPATSGTSLKNQTTTTLPELQKADKSVILPPWCGAMSQMWALATPAENRIPGRLVLSWPTTFQPRM